MPTFKWLILLLLYIFVTKFILRTLLCNNTILHNFNFFLSLKCNMEVKLNLDLHNREEML